MVSCPTPSWPIKNPRGLAEVTFKREPVPRTVTVPVPKLPTSIEALVTEPPSSMIRMPVPLEKSLFASPPSDRLSVLQVPMTVAVPWAKSSRPRMASALVTEPPAAMVNAPIPPSGLGAVAPPTTRLSVCHVPPAPTSTVPLLPMAKAIAASALKTVPPLWIDKEPAPWSAISSRSVTIHFEPEPPTVTRPSELG